MGLQDRDWYREEYQEKEKKYGSDFSGKGNKQQAKAEKKPSKAEKKPPKAEPHRVIFEKNIFSTVTSDSGAYSTMRLGSDGAMMNVLGVCPRCQNCFAVKVLKGQLYHYDYTCPECGQKVTIQGKKKRSVVLRVLLGIVGVAALIFIVGYMGNMLHDQLFPKIHVWFLETFGKYL